MPHDRRILVWNSLNSRRPVRWKRVNRRTCEHTIVRVYASAGSVAFCYRNVQTESDTATVWMRIKMPIHKQSMLTNSRDNHDSLLLTQFNWKMYNIRRSLCSLVHRGAVRLEIKYCRRHTTKRKYSDVTAYDRYGVLHVPCWTERWFGGVVGEEGRNTFACD